MDSGRREGAVALIFFNDLGQLDQSDGREGGLTHSS